jgi:hypothetical protein
MADLVEEKAHARLSPSGAKRWMTCPGSIQLAEKLGIKDKTSKYAAEGTVAHEVHELCLVKKQQAKEYLGRTIEADGMKFKVNQNMVDAVQLSLDYIWDRIEMADLEGLRVEIQVEVRSSLEYLGIPGLDGGTSDVVLLFWNDQDDLVAIEVFDYKHGAGVAVEAIDNPQAMCYGLGIVEKYDANPETTIEITISQPRAHHPDGLIRTWTTKAKELRNWQDEELVPAAKETQNPDADLVPSDSGCRFCKAAGDCPKLFERTQEVAMMDFDDPEPQLPDVQKLTADQKRFVMDHAAMLRSFIVAVEDQVKSEVDHGSKEYEGHYKLVRKTTRRKFIEDATDELVSPLFDHLEHGDVFEEKSRSMTEIERRLKKAVGAKAAKEIMADITTKPEGELVIAPQTDKRKAVEPTIVSDFTGLEN